LFLLVVFVVCRVKSALISYHDKGMRKPPRALRFDLVCWSLAGGSSQGRTTPSEEKKMGSEETGQVTGTKDKDYNVIWFTEQCLSNVLRLETYVEDADRAGDSELAEFFRRAQETSRKGAEQGKQMLAQRLSA
jgi:hypothetical protein